MTVLVFDIETIHDLAAARRVLKMPDADDDTIREAIKASTLVNDRGFIKPALHQVVCVGVLTVDKAVEGWKIEKQRTLCGDEFDEVKLVGGFFNHMRAVEYPQLVTFNGGGFDLPVLCYRAMLHRIYAPQLFVRRYFYRYGEDHLDLCDVLSRFGSSTKMKLDELARTFGLPGKPDGVDGRQLAALTRASRMNTDPPIHCAV
jgi:3'-5' exonuclease